MIINIFTWYRYMFKSICLTFNERLALRGRAWCYNGLWQWVVYMEAPKHRNEMLGHLGPQNGRKLPWNFKSLSGVGRLGLVDADTVALSNLHRQIGHPRHLLGVNKAKSLARSCHAINEEVNIEVHSCRLSQLEEAAELISRDLAGEISDGLMGTS